MSTGWRGELEAVRLDAESTESALAKHEANLQTVVDQIRRVGHERDLTIERLAALNRRKEDMQDTQEGLDHQADAVEQDLAAVELELREATRALQESRQSNAELQRQVTRARDAQAARDRQQAHLASAALTIERKLNNLHRRWAVLDQRRESGAAERERTATANVERTNKIEHLAAEIENLCEQDASSDQEEQELEAAISEMLERAATAEREAQAARATVAEVDQRLGEARARLQRFSGSMKAARACSLALERCWTRRSMGLCRGSAGQWRN